MIDLFVSSLFQCISDITSRCFLFHCFCFDGGITSSCFFVFFYSRLFPAKITTSDCLAILWQGTWTWTAILIRTLPWALCQTRHSFTGFVFPHITRRICANYVLGAFIDFALGQGLIDLTHFFPHAYIIFLLCMT